MDFEESMRDSVETSGNVSEDRANRFYDRLRGSIHRYMEKKGTLLHKSADVLLLVPDIFMLLWRLVNDTRVNAKNKILLGSGIAYFIFPLDLMPEALMGPMGYMDDLVFGVYLLNKVLGETTPEVLRQHWSGSGDVLDSMQRVLTTADSLIGSDMLNRVKRLVK